VVSPAADTLGGNVASDASTTNDGTAAPAAVTAPANSAVKYFLKIDGVTGDVTQGAHKGSFAVDGFDIGEMTPFSNGMATGRTQFSPLSVDIHSLQGVSSVLADELTDKTIKSVELVAVETTAKGGVQTVYDLKLTNALVGSFENSPGGNGVETALGPSPHGTW
jgi:type VI protein secretion system component Hcp